MKHHTHGEFIQADWQPHGDEPVASGDCIVIHGDNLVGVYVVAQGGVMMPPANAMALSLILMATAAADLHPADMVAVCEEVRQKLEEKGELDAELLSSLIPPESPSDLN